MARLKSSNTHNALPRKKKVVSLQIFSNPLGTTMKRVLFLLFFAVAISQLAQAQKDNNQFVDLNFGMSSSEVLRKMEDKGFLLVGDTTIDAARSLYFTADSNILLNGFHCHFSVITLLNGELFSFSIIDSVGTEIDRKLEAKYREYVDNICPIDMHENPFLMELMYQNFNSYGKVIRCNYNPDNWQMAILFHQPEQGNLFMAIMDIRWFNESLGLHDLDENNKVTSLSGCNFGDTKTNVTAQLNRRYGAPLNKEDNEVDYNQITIGGHTYDWAAFYFKKDPRTGNMVFVSAKLEKHYYTYQADAAKADYQGLVRQYSRKYTNLTSHEHDGLLVSQCGYPDKDLTYPITIVCEKGHSKGGDTFYYVSVYYYPSEVESLYDDDI